MTTQIPRDRPHPHHEIADPSPLRPPPRNPGCPHEPRPLQQRQRIQPDPQRGQPTKLTRRHMPQEPADPCDLNADTAHQHIPQRQIRTPHHTASPPHLQPSRTTPPRLTSTHRHEPESQHLDDTPSNRATPLARSTNTDHGPPINLTDGPPMFPMVRQPHPAAALNTAEFVVPVICEQRGVR